MSEQRPDSIIRAEERAARIRAQSEKIERKQAEAEAKRKQQTVEREAEIRKTEDADIAAVGLISSEETREHLLERIRDLRQEQSTVAPPPPPRTESMMRELEAEQAAGTAAVAKAEAEQDRNRELRAKVEADERARLGHMSPVHHPNPAQDEQFPATQATLGKRK